jgi:hypothetical protein
MRRPDRGTGIRGDDTFRTRQSEASYVPLHSVSRTVTSPIKLPARFATRVVAVDQVCGEDIAAWSALEARAIEPNAFLSPHFIIPAARHLTPDETPLIAFVERIALGGRELVGAGVFTEAAATYRTPVRRLVGYRSRYSLLSGLLLDRAHAAQALQALLQCIRTSLPHCKAVELPLVRGDGPLFDPAGIAVNASTHVPKIAKLHPRAILVVATCKEQLADRRMAARVRDIDRRQRRLRERGDVAWHWHRDARAATDAAESFLSLEHMGWKGDEGSSLRSRSRDEAFFREAVAGFASEGRALFSEVALDGTPIASMCNFISGNVGFGFKIGWNPAFRSFSPALINELEFMRHAPTAFSEIEYFDSGASATSFINELWPARRHMVTIYIPTCWVGASSIALADWAALLKAYARRSITSIATIRERDLTKRQLPGRLNSHAAEV